MNPRFFSFSVFVAFLTLHHADCGQAKGQMRSDEYHNSYTRDYSQKPTARQLSSTGTAYVDDDFGSYAAASGGHGHGHGGGGGHGGGYGGGGGGGWGHGGGGGGYGGGGGGYGKKADCNSALGLLGVLGLASYLQSVLRQTTTTMMMMMMPAMPPPRNKRDAEEPLDHVRITSKVLPMLSAIGHARDGLVPHHCVHKPICRANRILVDELGEGHGASVASMVSHAAAKFLTNGKETKNSKFLHAAKTGRTKGDCNDYQHCKPLDSLPTYGIPPSGMF